MCDFLTCAYYPGACVVGVRGLTRASMPSVLRTSLTSFARRQIAPGDLVKP
jgi:hypothetical protein